MNTRGHLARECFLALAKRPGKIFLVDRTARRREVRRGFLLVLAWMLSRRILQETDKKRVGIVFPPGMGACVANLAVVLGGKVPVNLNFTLGPSAVQACLEKADLDCLLTAEAVQSRIPEFPWPEDALVIDVVEALRELPKWRTLCLFAGIRCLPASWMAEFLRLPREGGSEEAGLLFTSGSSGDPKGVILSHRNILANCEQISSVGLITKNEQVMANVPVFHSFGFTVTLWCPILTGCRIVSLPSPLEVKKAAEVIDEESVTVLIGTPTFLRPYLKRVEAEKLQSLRYVVAGAEKTPEGFAEAWEEKFSGSYLEGYGLTETSPVVSVNTPKGNRRGSVGRLLPDIKVRFLDPETLEELPSGSVGILALRGWNIFEGYLNEPEGTSEVLRDGWFMTGDLARMDADGFLYIEGRLSRFSKIGGEMVPHGTIEQALNKALDLTESEVPQLAVSARPDAAKGEALVVLSAVALEAETVREKLAAAGFGNLWIPREIVRVEAIPTLATGKLDLRAMKELISGA
ncbi:MAG: AMP-binding protein [Coraliomargaritaceae bacterium]